jgi:hypothetical protein
MLDGNYNGAVTGQFSSILSNNVKLYIFTPYLHGNQVIRPYIYRFDDNLVDTFLNGNGAVDTLKRMGSMQNNGISGAILPSTNGFLIDTTYLDNLYSFILLIDAVDPVRSMISLGGPKRRTILTGYFYDEPINPFTMYTSSPTLNPNALMLFTHNNSFLVNSGNSYGQNIINNITINANADIVPQSLDQTVGGIDLSLCDISSLANAYSRDIYSNESIPTGQPLKLANHCKNAPILSDRVKSPKHQLIDIAYGIDQSFNITKNDHKIFGGLEGSLVGDNQHELFINNLYSHLQRPDIASIQQGVDPSKHMLMSDLTFMFPNIDVITCSVPYKADHDIRDQRESNIQTVFSSLVNNVVSSYAISNLLGRVAFRYASWMKNPLEGRGGAWNIEVAELIIGAELNQTVLESSVNNFINAMESGLFPILINAGGEFDLSVSYDATGATTVDLFFMDYSSESRGYYVAHNKLGGMISPAIGSVDNAQSNRIQFDELVTKVANNGFMNKQNNWTPEIWQ